MLKQGFREPVFEIASKLIGPMVPVADAGENEMIQYRTPPKGAGVLDPALRKSIGEPLEVDLQNPPFNERGSWLSKRSSPMA